VSTHDAIVDPVAPAPSDDPPASPPLDPQPLAEPPRSRRHLLAGAVGGLLGAALAGLGRPLGADAAPGDPLIIGNTANNAGTSNTSLTTSSGGTALLVTQDGAGTALRGSAVGTGSIAGFFTANNGTGISGVTGNPSSFGVFGQNNGAAGNGAAMRADGNNNHGIVASTDNATKAGVYGIGAAGDGIRGETQSIDDLFAGVFGRDSGGTAFTSGVFGQSDSTNGSGVTGVAFADSLTAFGVFGGGTGEGVGVVGQNDTGGVALLGLGHGAVTGDWDVAGTLTKGAGAFKIDHPLDPANKYLLHSFVESPDMKNVYDGLVTLDAEGGATVELPDWWEALNGDVRYQLTPIGGPAPELHVSKTMAKNRFSIGGGAAGQEISWQVTGIRRDAYAEANRIPVELAKETKEKGRYLHPAAHGQPASKATMRPLRKTAKN
jgi:hypothetical protein